MKSLLKTLIVPLLCLAFAASAFAADPTGTWKWTNTAPNDQSFDQTLKLEFKDKTLSGKIETPRGETEISDATFTDDTVQFSVVRERDGHKRVTKYHGKIEGDTIKGAVDMEGRDGNHTRDWVAHRST